MNTESQSNIDQRYAPDPKIQSAVNNLIEIFNEAASLIGSVQQNNVQLESKIKEYEVQTEDLQKRNQDLNAKLITLEEKVINYDEQIELLKEQYDQNLYNVQKVDSIKSEYQNLKVSYDNLIQELADLKKKNEILSISDFELVQEREKSVLLSLENQKLNDKINELIESQKNQSYAKDEIIRKNFEINTKIEEIDNLKIKVADFQNIIYEIQRQKNEIETEYFIFKEKVDKENQQPVGTDGLFTIDDGVLNDNDTLKLKLKDYESEIELLHKTIEELKETEYLNKENSENIKILENKIFERQNEITVKESQINYLSDKLIKLQEQVHSGTLIINSKEDIIQKLNQDISAISANKLISELNEKENLAKVDSLKKEINSLKNVNSELSLQNNEFKQITQLVEKKEEIIKELSTKLHKINNINLENEIKIKDYENKIHMDKLHLKDDMDKTNSFINTEKQVLITKIENVINNIEKVIELNV
jgi:hypothetical protein